MTSTNNAVTSENTADVISVESLRAHFLASATRYEGATAKHNATKHLIRAYVVRHHGGDAALELLKEGFGLGEKSAGVELSILRRNVAALDLVGWPEIPSNNKDVTAATVDLMGAVRKLNKGGTLAQMTAAIKSALDDGVQGKRALEVALTDLPKKPSKPRANNSGSHDDGTPNRTPQEEGPGESNERNNKTDAKPDDRSAFVRLAEALAAATALAGDLGEITQEQLTALHDAYANLGDRLPASVHHCDVCGEAVDVPGECIRAHEVIAA